MDRNLHAEDGGAHAWKVFESLMASLSLEPTLGFLPPEILLDKYVVFLWVKLLSGRYSVTFTRAQPN